MHLGTILDKIRASIDDLSKKVAIVELKIDTIKRDMDQISKKSSRKGDSDGQGKILGDGKK